MCIPGIEPKEQSPFSTWDWSGCAHAEPKQWRLACTAGPHCKMRWGSVKTLAAGAQSLCTPQVLATSCPAPNSNILCGPQLHREMQQYWSFCMHMMPRWGSKASYLDTTACMVLGGTLHEPAHHPAACRPRGVMLPSLPAALQTELCCSEPELRASHSCSRGQ